MANFSQFDVCGQCCGAAPCRVATIDGVDFHLWRISANATRGTASKTLVKSIQIGVLPGVDYPAGRLFTGSATRLINAPSKVSPADWSSGGTETLSNGGATPADLTFFQNAFGMTPGEMAASISVSHNPANFDYSDALLFNDIPNFYPGAPTLSPGDPGYMARDNPNVSSSGNVSTSGYIRTAVYQSPAPTALLLSLPGGNPFSGDYWQRAVMRTSFGSGSVFECGREQVFNFLHPGLSVTFDLVDYATGISGNPPTPQMSAWAASVSGTYNLTHMGTRYSPPGAFPIGSPVSVWQTWDRGVTVEVAVQTSHSATTATNIIIETSLRPHSFDHGAFGQARYVMRIRDPVTGLPNTFNEAVTTTPVNFFGSSSGNFFATPAAVLPDAYWWFDHIDATRSVNGGTEFRSGDQLVLPNDPDTAPTPPSTTPVFFFGTRWSLENITFARL